MKGIQAIIFDLDGTLYDSREFIGGACDDVATTVFDRTGTDKKAFLKKLLESYKEKTSYYGKHIDDVLAAFELDPELVRDLKDIHNAHQPTITLYPGVSDLLKLLRRQYRLGLLTDGDRAKQERKIELLGIKPYFDQMCLTSEFGVGYHKPHPRGYEEMMRRLKLRRKHRMMAVGDNPFTDFSTASSFGMITVRVKAGEFANVEYPEDVKADHEIKDIRELPLIIAEEEE